MFLTQPKRCELSIYLISCPAVLSDPICKGVLERFKTNGACLMFGTVLESVSLVVMRRHLRAVRSVSSEMAMQYGEIKTVGKLRLVLQQKTLSSVNRVLKSSFDFEFRSLQKTCN
ncbi:hypothetical protein L1887_35883 [Cichorium endivia]|nr:hypothetical protein L1887_35883 [Cichorium endivia]